MRRHLFPIAPAVLVALAAGCSDESRGNDDSDYYECLQAETAAAQRSAQRSAPQGPFAVSLLESRSDEIASAVREDLKTEMRVEVEGSRAMRIAEVRCEHLRPAPEGVMYAGGSSSGGAMPASDDRAASESGGAKQVSGTNNQVAGVDEADFIKNDDKYIYVVSGSTFRIIEAWPAPDAHEIAKVTVPGEARKLFVEGNRALVYSAVPRQGASEQGQDEPWWDQWRASTSECTYGYDGCVPSGDGTETELSIFDITNRAAPQLVRSIHSSSSLVTARRIGNAIHTVLGEPSPLRAGWTRSPVDFRFDAKTTTEQEINAAYDALIAENTAKIDRIDAGAILPKWSDSAGRAPDMSLYRSGMPDGSSLTSVMSIDLASDPTIKVASVIGRPGWVYASADALYMAVPHQQISGWGWFEGRTENELSTIHKFSIGTSPATTSYVATGVVKGRVLNQFAMDEHEGFLRVATTTGRVPSPDVHSTISVFESTAGKLDVVGQIDQIAKTEDIRSVRFDGTRGYIVTFKKTDPLFVFDLADPRAPKTLGELKIPGFSTYMHMMDPTHLLTIGYDAADHGDFAYFTGVLLQIFDVSNPSDPRLAHKEVIGTRGSSSEALTNHLAFNYFAPKNLLALPMTVCEGGDGNGHYGTQMTFSGLMVYDTTVADGFSLRGKIAHPNASDSGGMQNGYGYYDQGCWNWWTNASSEVRRSIIMDDYVFSVSDRRIKVNDLRALATDIKELSLL